MTYARKMAHKAQDGWLNGPGGHAHALEMVEAVVAEAIEDALKAAGAKKTGRTDEYGQLIDSGVDDAIEAIRALALGTDGPCHGCMLTIEQCDAKTARNKRWCERGRLRATAEHPAGR